MCACVRVYVGVSVCGGEKTTSDVIPQVTATLFGVTGFSQRIGVAKQTSLCGQ